MWSSTTRNTTLALTCATLATYAAVQGVNRLVQWRAQQFWSQQRAKRDVPRGTLREFQAKTSRQWVALCGTVFDVTGDPFFDARSAGIYTRWVFHDVMALLVYGGVIDGRPENETEDALLDIEVQLDDVDVAVGETAKRRRLILDEWYARFHSRYEVIGQISDLYAGAEWESLRDKITPPPPKGDDGSGKPRRRSKCPMGFGAASVEQEEEEIAHDDVSSLREIRFQGRRYDVRGSSLFESSAGALAHFVGHDVTFALATQSNEPTDLDVVPTREYSYEEQLRLEQFRRLFAKELRVIASPSEKPTAEVVDVHQLIDQDVGTDEIRRVLDTSASVNVNAVCPRTTMTPLHKAVEKNRADLVQLLLGAGADVAAPAALYDDETALQMAQRFRYTAITTLLAGQ